MVAFPAKGQVPAPPVHQTIDGNGVDLFYGTFNISQTDVSIGPSGPRGLAYTRENRGRGWRDSYTVTLNQITNVATVSIGGSSDDFSVTAPVPPATIPTYTSLQGNGATLVALDAALDRHRYTSPEGVVIEFKRGTFSIQPTASNLGLVESITLPSGERTNFFFKSLAYCYNPTTRPIPPDPETCISSSYRTTYRLQSVTNNSGYQLKFSYATATCPLSPSTICYQDEIAEWQRLTSVTAINNAVLSCDPTADTCAGMASWPTATYVTTPDGADKVLAVTDAKGQVWRYKSNSSDQILAVRRPSSLSYNITLCYTSTALVCPPGSGPRVQHVYDGRGRWTYAYSDSGSERTTTVTDPLNNVQVYKFDLAKSRMTSVKNALNNTTSYEYDSLARMTKTTMPEGNSVEYTYDARGNVTQTKAVPKPGSPLANIISSASFDATCTSPAKCNKPNSTTDPRGKVTDYMYDTTHGGVTSVTYPAPSGGANRPQTRFTYSALQGYFWYRNTFGTMVQGLSGVPISMVTQASTCKAGVSPGCVGTADETRTITDYGTTTSANNLLPVSATTRAGDNSVTATVSTAYDSIGNPISVDGPLAGTADTTVMFYDVVRQLVGAIGPDPDGAGALKNRATKTTYNADGQVTLVERGTTVGQTAPAWAAFVSIERQQSTYDAQARKVSDRLAASSTGTYYTATQYAYDDAGRPTCTAQRMNAALFDSLPNNACIIGTAGTVGPDRLTRNSYDGAYQVLTVETAVSVPSQQRTVVTNTYRANGTVETVSDANNNKTTYEYDGFDRRTKLRYPSTSVPGQSSTTDFEEFTYDAGSNVTNRRLRDTTSIASAYDDLNRLTTVTPPVGTTAISYTYDNVGNPLSVTSGANVIAFSWDALGRQRSETGGAFTKTSEYDAAGRRTRLIHGTSIASFYVDYDYLVTGETWKVRENGATVAPGLLATYSYDDLGRRTSLARGNGASTSYSYDPVSRLAGLVQTPASGTLGNTLGFSWSPANQMLQRTSLNDAYAYRFINTNRTATANGLNQLTNIGKRTITHDALGNVTAIGERAYEYDAFNRLKKGLGIIVGYDAASRVVSVGSTGLTYDGKMLIAETTGATVNKRYVHGSGVDEPLVWYEGADTNNRRWLHADERGSIVAISGSGGTVTNVNSYDEYGTPALTNVGRFQYTGQAWMPEVGLHYYKARFYDPMTGRFMQTDPIGYRAGMNLYSYVAGDPTNRSDPSGLDAKYRYQSEFMQLWGGGRIFQSDPFFGNIIGRDVRGMSVRMADFYVQLAAQRQLAFETGLALYEDLVREEAAAANIGYDPTLVPTIPWNAPGASVFIEAGNTAVNLPLGRILGQVPGIGPMLRGIAIHKAFADIITGLGNSLYTAEVSYKGGVVVPYGTAGSVRADAVYGSTRRPQYVIDLKTGGASMTKGELDNYRKNLPLGVPVYQLTEVGMGLGW